MSVLRGGAGSDAKQEILRAIRTSLGDIQEDRVTGGDRIPRSYQIAGSLHPAEVLALFEERLHDYDATAHRCLSEELPGKIAECLRARGKSKVVIPADLPESWLPGGYTFVRDEGLSYAEMDDADGVITGCSIAIALTGTIILQEGAPGDGRRALSLVPDYHLCIVRTQKIVETVPQGMRALEATATHATTTISGPSATSDIEMIRIRGVHGPRTLEVIIVTPT